MFIDHILYTKHDARYCTCKEEQKQMQSLPSWSLPYCVIVNTDIPKKKTKNHHTHSMHTYSSGKRINNK